MAGLVSTKGYGLGIPPSNKVVIPFSLTIYDLEGNEVGYIISLSYETTRRVERIRHLNAFDAGRIIEQAPAPEDFSVTAEGFTLYTDDLANPQSVIGRLTIETGIAVFECLNQQRIPFNVVKEVVHPATGIGYRTIFFECWLARYSETFATRNIVVSATASIQPTYVESRIVQVSGVGGKEPPKRG